MRLAIIGLLILTMISCQKTQQEKLNFELIDISICDAWRNCYSFKVTNDGKAYVLNDRRVDGKKYFVIYLKSNELDSISKLSTDILKAKLDTAYGINEFGIYTDGDFYNLIIKTKTRIFKSFIAYGGGKNNDIAIMKRLIDYLHKLAYNYKKSVDSLFVFESMTNKLMPPPPPPSENPIRYLTPVITDSIKK